MTANLLKNILSLGALGRTERALEDFRRFREEVQSLIEAVNARAVEVNCETHNVIQAKRAGVESLRKMKTIAKNLSTKDRDFAQALIGEPFTAKELAAVDGTISAVDMATAGVRGVGAGASTAMGAWTLVTAYGAASTGTALSSLSGAALTNATLAWFGGGTLAMGGGGIAVGSLVIAGIVVVPATALTALLAHLAANKKIAEIKKGELKLVEVLDECKKMDLILDLAEQRSRELTIAIDKAREAFDLEVETSRRSIYSFGWFSRAVRWCKRAITGRYFFQSDLIEISRLVETASAVARLIDQKVLDAEGNIIRGDIDAPK